MVRERKPGPQSGTTPRVAIVIPARDEAPTIRACISSCASQNYAGEFRIFLVDDHSTDGTADLARAQRGPITIVPATPLPDGWTGKLWAVQCGLEPARAFHPEFILLTDADIVHSPKMLSGLVNRAEEDMLDLASYMVKLRCESFAEKALIPAFVYFFFQLYPPRWIADLPNSTAGAAGGCILIRTSALERIGGIASIRNELIDDCALAKRVKQSGGRIWLGITSESNSIREYNTVREIRRMISRTAFTQLNYSAWLLAGTVLGLLFTYILPLLTESVAAYLLMTLSYLPLLRFYKRSPLWALTLPLVAVFYAAATIDSALRHWRGAGGEWKGRFRKA